MQTTTDGKPGPDDWRAWVRRFIDDLTAEIPVKGLLAPEVTRDVVRWMPSMFMADAAYHGVAPFVRKDMKERIGLLGIPCGSDGADESAQTRFKRPEQLELPEALAWARAGHERQIQDVKARRRQMNHIVETHPQWGLTVDAFCAQAGVPVPR